MAPQQVAVPFLQGKETVNSRADLAAHIPVVQGRCQYDYTVFPAFSAPSENARTSAEVFPFLLGLPFRITIFLLIAAAPPFSFQRIDFA